MSPTSGRADTRAIVECLLAAHYSDGEILDYLIGRSGSPRPTRSPRSKRCAGRFASADGAGSTTGRAPTRH